MPNAMVGTSKERINQLGHFLPTKGRSMGRTEPQSLSYEVGVVRPLHTVNIRASLHAFCIIIIGTISAAPRGLQETSTGFTLARFVVKIIRGNCSRCCGVVFLETKLKYGV